MSPRCQRDAAAIPLPDRRLGLAIGRRVAIHRRDLVDHPLRDEVVRAASRGAATQTIGDGRGSTATPVRAGGDLVMILSRSNIRRATRHANGDIAIDVLAMG